MSFPSLTSIYRVHHWCVLLTLNDYHKVIETRD